jgi:hypothetical protein
MINVHHSGNTLGTIYTPCQAAAEGLFSPLTSSSSSSATHRGSSPAPLSSTRPQHPSGPAYWLPRPSSDPASAPHTSTRATDGGRVAVFTFFAGSVRPAPGFLFPPQRPAAPADLTPEAVADDGPPGITVAPAPARNARRWSAYTWSAPPSGPSWRSWTPVESDEWGGDDSTDADGTPAASDSGTVGPGGAEETGEKPGEGGFGGAGLVRPER